MRELKFRAWGYEPNKKWEMYIPYLGEVNDINDEISNLQEDGHIIMQYTGLKDKNGVEIYEGDIMSLGVSDETFVVKYEMNKFVLEGSFVDYGAYPYFVEREVIGNIHENKELLK